MKRAAWAILVLTSTLSLSAIAFAQQKVTDFGEREFENSCADCHGMDAKGKGVLAANLKVAHLIGFRRNLTWQKTKNPRKI